jgi:type IV pilus assembly protein PilQ
VRADDETIIVDLTGVRAQGPASDGRWSGHPLKAYRLVEYRNATGQPVVRVHLTAERGQSFTTRQEASGVRLLLSGGPGTSPQVSSVSSGVGSSAPRAATAAPASHKGTSAGPPRVSGVEIRAGAAGDVIIDVATTGPAPFDVFQLGNPLRLVVDLEGARNASSKRHFEADSALLRSVRLGQFRAANPSVVRVVADLKEDAGFDVHSYSGGVRIHLKPRGMPSIAASEAPAEKPAVEEVAEEVAPPPVVPETVVEEVVQAAATPAPEEAKVEVAEAVAEPHAESAPSAPATEASPGFDLASTLPSPTPSADVAAAPRVETPAAASTHPATVVPAVVSPSSTVSAYLSAVAQGNTSEMETPRYTGEPISLNLKDVDLKDFFRLIHEISGLNIIVDPNVTGNVTLVLDSVPWDQALDIVLANARLGKTLVGNVLRIARLETLTAEREAESKLALAREEAQPLVTVFRPINYAKAGSIATMLKAWPGGGALSRRGTALVDERTNTLIISDIQTQIPVIESIITRLDTKAKQVSIEARIVRASADFVRNFSAALNAGWVNKSGSTLTGASTGSSASATTQVPPGQILLAPATASGFGSVAVTNVGARYFINAAIAAAEQRSQAKTISRPSIVTQNNVPGTVQQGTQIPIQTTINNTISIQYVNAALTLRVTPQVTDDGNIFLDIQVTNAAPGAVLTGAGPSINTQEATTQVLVPDGGTVVFGGVTVTSRTRSVTQVPLVGSIPLLGHLFKSSVTQDADQELLFFVSPKVLPG